LDHRTPLLQPLVLSVAKRNMESWLMVAMVHAPLANEKAPVKSHFHAFHSFKVPSHFLRPGTTNTQLPHLPVLPL